MRLILTIVCVALLVSACEKERHEEIRKFVSFQMDSVFFIGENPKAVITKANLTDTDPNNDIDKLTITASGEQAEKLNITLIGTSEGLDHGVFRSQDGNRFSVYYDEPNISQIADQTYGSFTLSISRIKDSLMEASFYGTAVDTSGTFNPKPVTHGYIRAIVTAD
ncbi:hypothetical protein [Chitinophaga pinensis]|uniref:Uncharacterized protein n=1 Tax=Chitinophaga pinensis TaxID=79329 RepID=A0A5C6LPI9_9BACT|nr:hypothetical protein [Chitinophaga pinensis]TWV99052.1 hypothetical protein FEF09_18530 [Chitinophaga pinensis]